MATRTTSARSAELARRRLLPARVQGLLGYSAEGSGWERRVHAAADRGNQVLDLLANEGLGERPLVFTTTCMGNRQTDPAPCGELWCGSLEAVARQTQASLYRHPAFRAHVANFAELARAVYRTNEQVKELTAHDRGCASCTAGFQVPT